MITRALAIGLTGASAASVYAALATGVLILCLRPSSADAFAVPASLRRLAFPWQLCIGTGASLLVCLCGSGEATSSRATSTSSPVRTA